MVEEVGKKPPWLNYKICLSPFFLTPFSITYDLSWNEIDHTDLTNVKILIEPLEKNHQWEQLKKKTNPYELIYTQESRECPPSISILKPLSRSYFKMIEILHIIKFFERLPKNVNRLRSAHVAEGPGGFIEAFLDKTSSLHLTVQRATGITLKPTNNYIPGWKRTNNFLQKHSEIKIHYGEDGTGDIYKLENQQSFIKIHEGGQKVNLFTGDGGFDFSIDYKNQEKDVFRLLVASAIIGIQVLKEDGSFILKLFDIFSDSTQCLIRLITICFREWTIYKPSTSRPCNSERYLLCYGFRKIYPSILQQLYDIQNKLNGFYPHIVMLNNGFTEMEMAFLKSHIEESKLEQKDALLKTIELSSSLDTDLFDWKNQINKAEQWCQIFKVPCNFSKKM